jgi:subtilisin family serine protease
MWGVCVWEGMPHAACLPRDVPPSLPSTNIRPPPPSHARRYTATNIYYYGSGTSFSAPIVTGLAATIWGALPAGACPARAAGVRLRPCGLCVLLQSPPALQSA